MLQEFKDGQRVQVIIEPAVHKGMPHPRFHGKMGEVLKQKGRAFIVKIKDGGKEKLITCHAVHLKQVK